MRLADAFAWQHPDAWEPDEYVAARCMICGELLEIEEGGPPVVCAACDPEEPDEGEGKG